MSAAVAGTLLGLADRCEQATGPGAEERQLVIDAYNLLFPHELRLSEDEQGDDQTRYARTLHRVRFTTYINNDYERASIDAAMMLVPEGFDWAVHRHTLSGTASAHIYLVKEAGPARTFAKTPALALCAAALRARAAQ